VVRLGGDRGVDGGGTGAADPGAGRSVDGAPDGLGDSAEVASRLAPALETW
jgi:hypothetical protein